jgi:hypothetical protein
MSKDIFLTNPIDMGEYFLTHTKIFFHVINKSMCPWLQIGAI